MSLPNANENASSNATPQGSAWTLRRIMLAVLLFAVLAAAIILSGQWNAKTAWIVPLESFTSIRATMLRMGWNFMF